MYSEENDKIIYLKGLQKGLTMLNNNNPNVQQELNKINTMIYKLEHEKEHEKEQNQNQIQNQIQNQNTFKSNLDINYKEEKINKYKNYLQFLEFRKSKIEKSIQEQVYNHTINIDKLNKNLSKTIINIEKYSKLLNEINENNSKTEEKLINENNSKTKNHEELNIGIKDFITTEAEELNKHVLIPVEQPIENNINETEKNELKDVLGNIMNNLNS